VKFDIHYVPRGGEFDSGFQKMSKSPGSGEMDLLYSTQCHNDVFLFILLIKSVSSLSFTYIHYFA